MDSASIHTVVLRADLQKLRQTLASNEELAGYVFVEECGKSVSRPQITCIRWKINCLSDTPLTYIPPAS